MVNVIKYVTGKFYTFKIIIIYIYEDYEDTICEKIWINKRQMYKNIALANKQLGMKNYSEL